MTGAEQRWLLARSAEWGALVDDLRAQAVTDPAVAARAEGLASIVAGLRRRLEAAPIHAPPAAEAPSMAPAPEIAVETPPADDAPADGDVTWGSPIFWPGGRFDPWAGSKRERMLASAATCRSIGEARAAAVYERHAADATERPVYGLRADFSFPVPEALPFTAGPQMDMFG